MAWTSGLFSAWLRSSSPLAAFCSLSVGLPAADDTVAIQRRPVHLLKSSLRRGARSGGALGCVRNSIRPGSQRTSCT
jgi:hypothetical protein